MQFPTADLAVCRSTDAKAARRRLGAYYTPTSTADFLADWTIRADGERILEPSFGDGIFLQAVLAAAARKGVRDVRLAGVEINGAARAKALQTGLISEADAYLGDFLGMSPYRVNAVIGNPPYVRLRKLTDGERHRATAVARTVMGKDMDPSGSLWMPFVLHAMNFLEPGGRLALVLPYELTYVRYARPLWQMLRRRFGSLRVLRAHERLFPDLLQEVVILLADEYGSHTDIVRFQAFERVEDLLRDTAAVDETLDIDNVIRGERVFLSALLDPRLRTLLAGPLAEQTVPARKLITFNIGYVAGDKGFFHPSEEQAQHFGLPAAGLRSALTSTRAIRGTGLRTSSLPSRAISRLFLPDPNALSHGERRYIRIGELQGVPLRYKCRVREPWFVVPGVRVPDVMLSVFSERPILLLNDSELVSSNSLLCGYRKSASAEGIAAGWYTSLTLLQCELEVHALGGGVLVMVPREAGNIRLPVRIRPRKEHLEEVDRLLRLSRPEDAYRAGDTPVLRGQLGLARSDIELIRHGVEVLAHWRTSARQNGISGSDDDEPTRTHPRKAFGR
jgi:hypothetical protein